MNLLTVIDELHDEGKVDSWWHVYLSSWTRRFSELTCAGCDGRDDSKALQTIIQGPCGGGSGEPVDCFHLEIRVRAETCAKYF